MMPGSGRRGIRWRGGEPWAAAAAAEAEGRGGESVGGENLHAEGRISSPGVTLN